MTIRIMLKQRKQHYVQFRWTKRDDDADDDADVTVMDDNKDNSLL